MRVRKNGMWIFDLSWKGKFRAWVSTGEYRFVLDGFLLCMENQLARR